MIYFTADTHFFHRELLGDNPFAPRMFKTVNQMNQAIIDHWNLRVQPNDQVYLLGDVALVPSRPAAFQQVHEVLTALNGHLTIIKGNHDNRAFLKYLAKHNQPLADQQMHYQFEDVGALIKVNHRQYFLTHYPLLFGQVRQTINLHGHIHHQMLPIAENINVGLDAPERALLANQPAFGQPLSVTEIETIFERKQAALARANQR